MRRITAATVLTVLVLLGACSSDGSDDDAVGTDTSTEVLDTDASSDDSTPAAESTEDTSTDGTEEAAAGDMEDFCDTFPELGGDAQDQALTAEQWEMRIATVEQIAATAPDEIEAQAEAYIEMTEARAELAAANDYAAATEIDAATREEFIGEVGALQVQVNELIAYAREECDLDAG